MFEFVFQAKNDPPTQIWPTIKDKVNLRKIITGKHFKTIVYPPHCSDCIISRTRNLRADHKEVFV
jgi:hypothetical protein